MSARRRLITGIVCGLLAAVAVLAYASSVRASERAAREEALARYGGEQLEVCVASRDIAAGDTIRASDITHEMWLADLLPAECVSDDGEAVGAVAGTSILANEPISRARLGNANADISVPPGLCAVSIPTQDVRAVGGAVSRGSLVNVYSNTGGGVLLLGENLLVLATSGSDKGSSGTRASLSWVTLAVTPQSVQELLSASKSETLYLTLPSTESASQGSRTEQGSKTTAGADDLLPMRQVHGTDGIGYGV